MIEMTTLDIDRLNSIFNGKVEHGTYYHGSNVPIDELRAGSWVTATPEAALAFGVPGMEQHLIAKGSRSNKISFPLKFKSGMEPPDTPLYLYSVEAHVRPVPTNTNGRNYYWNREMVEPGIPKLVKSYSSWKEAPLLYNGE